MIGFRWLSEMLSIAPMQLGAEVERSARRRRAAARLTASVMTKVQSSVAFGDEPSTKPLDAIEAMMRGEPKE